MNENLMIFLLFLFVHYVIFLSVVMYMHTKLVNTFGNWLIVNQALTNKQGAER